MSSSQHIGNKPRIVPTLAISAGALILGIPVAVAAISFEKTSMPNVILGSKDIKVGPDFQNGGDKMKTITFGLLTGPNDAVMAGAYISIISSLLFVVGLFVLRHVSQHNIFGWAIVFPGLADFFGNIAVLAYVFIVNGQHPDAASKDDVPFNDQTKQYETNGKEYTKQSWACTMDKFYAAQEPWAHKACNNFKTGKIMTAPMVICSLLLLGLSLWQVQRRGGFGWLLGRRRQIEAMSKSKAEYIDMQSN